MESTVVERRTAQPLALSRIGAYWSVYGMVNVRQCCSSHKHLRMQRRGLKRWGLCSKPFRTYSCWTRPFRLDRLLTMSLLRKRYGVKARLRVIHKICFVINGLASYIQVQQKEVHSRRDVVRVAPSWDLSVTSLHSNT